MLFMYYDVFSLIPCFSFIFNYLLITQSWCYPVDVDLDATENEVDGEELFEVDPLLSCPWRRGVVTLLSLGLR